ncbi:MAG: hypothetical protein WBO10_12825 [Pyrinomonadaceae bacterium]
MKKLLSSTEVNLWFDSTERPFKFESPFNNEEFAVLHVAADSNISSREQAWVSKRLVASRCRYAVCMGYESSTWDDSIDYAYIESDPNYEPPDDRFIMTTWHDGEPIEDVVNFFRWNTIFDDFVPKNFLVLFIGRAEEFETRTLDALKYSFREVDD